MKTLRLNRIATSWEEGTFGSLTINGNPFCVTLEPKRAQNESNISCIPTGQYLVKKYNSPKYGWTWQVKNVPERDFILFHAGNVDDHTKGCIILASSFGKLWGKWAVLNSGETFKNFLSQLKDETMVHLTVTECY